MSRSSWPLLFLSINSNTKYLEIRSLGNRVGETIQCLSYSTGMTPSSLCTWKGFIQHSTSTGLVSPREQRPSETPPRRVPWRSPRAWGEHREWGGSGLEVEATSPTKGRRTSWPLTRPRDEVEPRAVCFPFVARQSNFSPQV